MSIYRMDFAVYTDRIGECKHFYCNYLGFTISYEDETYLELRSDGFEGCLCFMLAQREAGAIFSGKGVMLCLMVEDVDAVYDRLLGLGVDITEKIGDRPWGERSFVVEDPNGMHIYVASAAD
ncbi:MAG: VOC family protein [Negativicutes bacterium]|nr:VOC family protein [Negativicutes bacterium]